MKTVHMIVYHKKKTYIKNVALSPLFFLVSQVGFLEIISFP